MTIQPAAVAKQTETFCALPGPPAEWQPGGALTAEGCLAEIWSDEDNLVLAEIERERQSATFREVRE